MNKDDLIKEFKKDYRDIYSVKLGKQEYIFRTLTFSEYRYIESLNATVTDIEEVVVEKALLHPSWDSIDLNKMLSGTVTALSEEILEYSNFVTIESIEDCLESARIAARSGVEMMKAFVLATMPGYKYEELDQFTVKELAHLVAIAEVIIEIDATTSVGETLKLALSSGEESGPTPQKTHNFTLEDLEKANRNLDSSTIGTAPLNDPIAQKLRAALG